MCYLLEVNGYSALKKNKETLYPIHLACKNGHLNVMVELLKECRCPSLFATDNGCNILHFAAKNGHANMVKAIIEIPETNMTMDEVVNKMDEDGNTPLHLASLHGHSQVVYALLRYGRSNHDLKNKQSMTTYKMALREYYMQTSIAEKQEKSMKVWLFVIQESNPEIRLVSTFYMWFINLVNFSVADNWWEEYWSSWKLRSIKSKE